MKKVLLLGAGRISGPFIDYLDRKCSCNVVVADLSEENLDLAKKFKVCSETVKSDACKEASSLIDRYKPDIVVNFLPPEYMSEVSKICLEKKVNMVHPAYLDEDTKNIADDIKKEGIIFIVELGLDPGIDHMSAARTIDHIHGNGGKVVSFRSLCGALPAPESNSNPWGYKLSWSPSSLIGASKRTAKILENDREIVWPEGETYRHVFLYEVPGLAVFEAYANADSLVYKEGYGIPEAKTIYRGTLRYPGWCETICYMNEIGFFETEKKPVSGMTFAAYTADLAGYPGDPKKALCKRFGLEEWSAFILRMEWLGVFENKTLPFGSCSPRDVVSLLFSEKLLFGPHEKDLVVLCDEVVAEYPDGARKMFKSTLIDFGVPDKWTSIARTTGVPPAIATRFILEGKIDTPGLYAPMSREIYGPVLEELRNEGIVLEETIINI
jgi:saccharopine dehydrogenase-like NADP-dependent oxidoreductase